MPIGAQFVSFNKIDKIDKIDADVCLSLLSFYHGVLWQFTQPPAAALPLQYNKTRARPEGLNLIYFCLIYFSAVNMRKVKNREIS